MRSRVRPFSPDRSSYSDRSPRTDLRANSLGHLEQIESYAPGYQVRFGSLNFTADIRGDLILDGFEPQPSVPHYHGEHDLALQPDSTLEAALEPAPIFDSEPAARIEDCIQYLNKQNFKFLLLNYLAHILMGP